MFIIMLPMPPIHNRENHPNDMIAFCPTMHGLRTITIGNNGKNHLNGKIAPCFTMVKQLVLVMMVRITSMVRLPLVLLVTMHVHGKNQYHWSFQE